MIIDVTTKNSVYDPTGAQGQWFQHRWGRRDYPEIELSWSRFQEVIQDVTDTIYLVCTYGDPADWNHLSKAIKLLKNQLHIVTYGMLSEETVAQIQQNNCSVTFLLDRTSTAHPIYQYTDWKIISNNIKSLNKQCFVEFVTYEHNLCDLPELLDMSKRYNLSVKLNSGLNTDGNITCIVNEQCEWLYDIVPYTTGTDFLRFSELSELVNSMDTSVSMPVKTVTGYNILRTYYKVQQHRNILEAPLISKEPLPQELVTKLSELTDKTNLISVSPTGHIFSNDMMYAMFMRLLGRDWLLSRSNLKINAGNQYMWEVLFYARKLLEQELTC